MKIGANGADLGTTESTEAVSGLRVPNSHVMALGRLLVYLVYTTAFAGRLGSFVLPSKKKSTCLLSPKLLKSIGGMFSAPVPTSRKLRGSHHPAECLLGALQVKNPCVTNRKAASRGQLSSMDAPYRKDQMTVNW